MNKPAALEDVKVPVKLKLSALWASLMFCYIYGDYFGMFQPGNLQEMLQGKMGPLGPTKQGVLLGTSVMMEIRSMMVFIVLELPAELPSPACHRVTRLVLPPMPRT